PRWDNDPGSFGAAPNSVRAPTEGYEDAIVVPAITADNFELKHGLLTLVQNKQFFGHDKEDPHAHVRYFNKITSVLKFPNVRNTSIRLMLFPFSLEGAVRIWLEKEPPRSIFTWDDLVSKFINQFFPPSKTTNLRNEITNFQQRFDESFSEAWDRFKDLIRACPHHGFSVLHQLDTFYNALNFKDQDSLNSAAGVSINTSTFGISPDVAELKDMVKALLLDKKSQNQSPAPVKEVEESYVTCGVNDNQGNTSYRPPMMSNQIRPPGFPPFVNSNSASTSSSSTLPSNTIANPRSDLKAITTQSGVSYDGPQLPPSTSFLPKVVENEPEATKDTVNPTNNGNTEDVQPQVVQSEYPVLTSEPITSPISEHAIALIFKDMSFEISFADALIFMPKFASTLKALIGNKEKLSKMARTLLNKHCSALLRKKLPEKLGDPSKFLIPCDFPGMAERLALADLGASINLMPFSVWKRLSLPDLTPMCMTLELGDRLISRPVGLIEYVYFKVGGHYFQSRPHLRYSANYSDMTAKRIDVIDMACEEYSQEVLGFSDTISSGNPTLYYDPIISTTSPTLTSFGNSDFLLEEVDAFLAIEDEPTSSDFYQPYLDPEGDILLLEAFLNDDPSPLSSQGNYLPEVCNEFKICETKSDKSLVDEPLAVELKDLPPHMEYAFLEGEDKLPVIIAKDLSVEEKTALITVLKSHKRAISWKLSEIKEVIKLLKAGLIYPISDSLWVSPVHCVPKKGGFTVVENEDNELILTLLVTGWRVCIDYRKLNEATRKDHFPLPFMDQMLERLAGNQYYCFLDGFSGYFQIPIDPKDLEKTTFTCPYGTFAYRRMSFGLCNAPCTFQRCMMAIFHDMIEKTMKEKSHFLVKEGIVLGHKISKQGIEVDKAKVDVITKLPHSTIVMGIRSFLGHAGFYRRFIKDFSKIARLMTRLLEE
nr:reverse transcriptase domain-containing protein [Tanacetum cinerariifolium]